MGTCHSVPVNNTAGVVDNNNDTESTSFPVQENIIMEGVHQFIACAGDIHAFEVSKFAQMEFPVSVPDPDTPHKEYKLNCLDLLCCAYATDTLTRLADGMSPDVFHNYLYNTHLDKPTVWYKFVYTMLKCYFFPGCKSLEMDMGWVAHFHCLQLAWYQYVWYEIQNQMHRPSRRVQQMIPHCHEWGSIEKHVHPAT